MADWLYLAIGHEARFERRNHANCAVGDLRSLAQARLVSWPQVTIRRRYCQSAMLARAVPASPHRPHWSGLDDRKEATMAYRFTAPFG